MIFNSFVDDVNRGNINPNVDTFKCLLTTNAYTPNGDTHTKRSDVTNEVVGTGYTAGGATVTCTVTKDNANNRIDLTFSNPSWPSSTITARHAVVYKSRGGAASADELVADVDFGSDQSSSGTTFTVTFNAPLRYQLP